MRSDAARIGIQQVPHRSLFNALGMTEEETRRSLMGVVSSYNEIVPNHIDLSKIVDAVKLGVAIVDDAPVVFPAIAIYGGITMEHIGMRHPLVTRDLITDFTGCMALAHQFDTLVMVPNCDRNVPGLLMAAARINVPTVFVSGGPILAGHVKGHKTSFSSMFEAVGAYVADNISERDVKEFEDKACPTCGSYSGMYTANSVNYLTKILGMGLKGNGATPAVYSERIKLTKRAGTKMMEMYEKNIRPRDIMAKEAFMNILTMDMALGRPTNSILHLPAIAHEAGVELNADVANEISARTPNLCHLAPAGPTYIESLNETGGICAIMKEINKRGLLNLDCITVTGRTVGESIKDCVDKNPEVIRPVENPCSWIGGIAMSKSNLAPNSTVVRRFVIAPEMLKHEKPARVFDCKGSAVDAIRGGGIVARDVMIIRYKGPKGDPGMREILNPTSAITGVGPRSAVALITGGRFSGASRGASIGHASSEAAVGDPIALMEEGDIISIDVSNHKLNVLVSDEEMATRKARWQPHTPQVTTDYLARYASLITSAERGAILQVK